MGERGSVWGSGVAAKFPFCLSRLRNKPAAAAGASVNHSETLTTYIGCIKNELLTIAISY